MITQSKIESDFFKLAKAYLQTNKFVKGDVYILDYRPRDSRNEDITIRFTTGQSKEIATGIVTICAFCNDINDAKNGTTKPDKKRLLEIEEGMTLMYQYMSKNSDYLLSLETTIYNSMSIDTHQHFSVMKVRYKFKQETY